MLAAALLLVAGMPGYSAGPDGGQEAAIAEIEKLGGKVRVDQKRPGKPVVEVDLAGTGVTDAGLVHLIRQRTLLLRWPTTAEFFRGDVKRL